MEERKDSAAMREWGEMGNKVKDIVWRTAYRHFHALLREARLNGQRTKTIERH